MLAVSRAGKMQLVKDLNKILRVRTLLNEDGFNEYA